MESHAAACSPLLLACVKLLQESGSLPEMLFLPPKEVVYHELLTFKWLSYTTARKHKSTSI